MNPDNLRPDAEGAAVAEARPESGAPLVVVPQQWWFYAVFAASGFAALIYESLWTRYLKILLGAAAYAQILVLSVMLLGLAAGAALAARHSHRIPRPLLAYAFVEALLALAALNFHWLFVTAQDWALYDVLPALDGDGDWFKWTLGAALILPQTVLLGSTFPMLAAAMARRWPGEPRNIVPALYFTNSIGGAIGILFGGFLLVPTVGLPGAGLIGGIINAVVAAVAWALSRRFGESAEPVAASDSSDAVASAPSPPVSGASAPVDSPALAKVLLLAAAITGMSSFIYEIVWIRMTSLLLGNSVYSFEIMLSVFIAGLAVGGLLARPLAERFASPMLPLALVQLLMGALALLSLIIYPLLFELNSLGFEIFERNHSFHVTMWMWGGLLAVVMILPAALCAGMTLPLATLRLLGRRGEPALGSIYAANTAGAVAGVLLAGHVLLPGLGVQNALIIGALGDLLLGVGLLAYIGRPLKLASALTVACVSVALVFGGIPLSHAVAGGYRHGTEPIDEERILFYRDGKTSSVSVVRAKEGDNRLSIRTNGKTDASIYYDEDGFYSNDEMTMTMSGLLPLMFNPHAEHVANIGFGSGLTSRTLLLSPALKSLDNIEIEPMMAAGARRMGPKVEPVFEDPRNNFIFDDAKAVFARSGVRYDIIVSEPSNPWISGISGLFTQEFYARVRSALADDGVFVQWLPFYESSPQIFASAVTALAAEFGDFRMYLSSSSDAIFVASPGRLPDPQNEIFNDSDASEFLRQYGYRSVDDLAPLLLGDREILLPYFRSFLAPVNSDYFPYVEHEAPTAFIRNTYYSLPLVYALPVPVAEIAGIWPPGLPAPLSLAHSPIVKKIEETRALLDSMDDPDGFLPRRIDAVAEAACAADDEEAENYMLEVSDFSALLLPHAGADAMGEVWARLARNECVAARLSGEDNTLPARYTRFWRALALRDAPAIIGAHRALLPDLNLHVKSGQIVMLAGMSAHLALARAAEGDEAEFHYGRALAFTYAIPGSVPYIHHAMRLLAAQVTQRGARSSL